MIIKFVDFLGVENFSFIIKYLLIDVANKLKVNEKKFYGTLLKEDFRSWLSTWWWIFPKWKDLM